MSVLSYMGGEDYLRYVMKNMDTGEVLFVVKFALLKKEDVEKDEKAAAERANEADDKEGERHEGEERFQPEADDLD